MKIILRLFIAWFPFLFLAETAFAQWQTHGPYGGSMYSLTNLGSYTFAGTNNGVFSTTDNGNSWTAANSGLQRKMVGSLSVFNNNLFAGTTYNGIFMSSDSGASWMQVNAGLLDTNIVSLFSTPEGLFTGTANGVYYSSNGQTWTFANNGIPSTYPIYSFAISSGKVFGGTYGFGLFSTTDSGATWTTVGGGFPPNSFVYALISDTTTLFAGTSNGVYRSTDSGNSWTSTNTGFPSGMWAKSFTITPGYVFAGTYSAGIFVSSDNGNTWSSADNGIPDLPLTNGLPTNYPSVQALIPSGTNILAATYFGMYRTTNNGTSWMEVNNGILATNVTAIAADNNLVIAGTEGTGIYVSTDAGNNWIRAYNGLTSVYVLAVTTNNSWSFASVLNTKVFRTNNNGGLWTSASTGLAASPKSFLPDSSRILALTQGQQFTPPAIYETVDNGLHWTAIPDPGIGYLSAIGLLNQHIYAGTDTGQVFVTNTNGASWQNISSNLPYGSIKSILPINTDTVFVALATSGIYVTMNGGTSWTTANTGITNLNITDVRLQNGILYSSTSGSGIFYSSNMGATWTAFNSGLDDLYVSEIASNTVNLYTATDAGVYSTTAIVNGIQNFRNSIMTLYPNPSTGKFYMSGLLNGKTQIKIYNAVGEVVYEYDGFPPNYFFVDLIEQPAGIYFLTLQNEKQLSVQKIILQKE